MCNTVTAIVMQLTNTIYIYTANMLMLLIIPYDADDIFVISSVLIFICIISIAVSL